MIFSKNLNFGGGTSLKAAFKTILFDVDDTLLDFSENEDQALTKTFSKLNHRFSSKDRQQYKSYNQHLWQQYENGVISRNYLLQTRFKSFFKQEFNEDINNEQVTKIFLNFLAQGHQKIQGAAQLLADLRMAGCHLFVASNGLPAVQRQRLQAAGLLQYFQALFVSGKIGYQKPVKEFFETAFQQIPAFDRQTAMIVGDSLSSDIKGGLNAGIKTVWFNPRHIKNPTAIRPDYEIADLIDLEKVV